MVKFKLSNVFNLKALIHEKLLPDDRIKMALADNYPSAVDIEWAFRNNFYEASFTHKGTYKVVSFDEKGSLKEEKRSISEKQLPSAILEILQNKYRLLFLVSAFEIHSSDTIFYEMMFDSEDKSRYLLLFDKYGVLINEQLLVAVKKDLH